MNKKELEQKILEIDQNLKSLGDLNSLIQSSSSQKQVLDGLITEIQAQKQNIDAIPGKKQELDALLSEAASLKETIVEQQNQTEETNGEIEAIKNKADEIHNLSLQQLGVISNEKLSNSFDKVKNDLKIENKSWFWWFFGTSISLLFAVAGVVIWQTSNGGSIFEINFLVKLAATSPIIFFEIFVSKQYSRTQKLFDEYEFKASIARSLEAYKEIIVDLFNEKEGDEFKKKLDFILNAIGKLYSSPMANIKIHETKEKDVIKNSIPVLSDIKEILSEVKDIVSK